MLAHVLATEQARRDQSENGQVCSDNESDRQGKAIVQHGQAHPAAGGGSEMALCENQKGFK